MERSILWIGGSPCSGKSSVARMLVDQFGLHNYNCDAAFERHARLVTPQAQPTFYRVMRYPSETLWMRPVDEQVREELDVYREQFPLILADLGELPGANPILAEGAALLPELVAPRLGSQRQAIWIVPSPDFQVQHYRQREWIHQVLKDCSNPTQAFDNWMQRDIGFAAMVLRQAAQLGQRAIVVDGSQPIEAITALVREHFNLV